MCFGTNVGTLIIHPSILPVNHFCLIPLATFTVVTNTVVRTDVSAVTGYQYNPSRFLVVLLCCALSMHLRYPSEVRHLNGFRTARG